MCEKKICDIEFLEGLKDDIDCILNYKIKSFVRFGVKRVRDKLYNKIESMEVCKNEKTENIT